MSQEDAVPQPIAVRGSEPVKTYHDPAAETQALNNFTYHPPQPELGQLYRYTELRRNARELAILFCRFVPPGRERQLALTNLQQAIQWANAGIAIGEAES